MNWMSIDAKELLCMHIFDNIDAMINDLLFEVLFVSISTKERLIKNGKNVYTTII